MVMALLVHSIDPHELAYLREVSRHYELAHHRPHIAQALDRIDINHVSLADARAVQLARDELTAYLEFHREYPFRVLPNNLLEGDVIVGYDVASGVPIRARPSQLARHTLITGASGYGKTTLVRSIIKQLLDDGVHLVIFDLKDYLRALAARDERFLVLHKDVHYNPLQRLDGMGAPETIQVFVECFAKVLYGGQNLTSLLTEVLTIAFRDHEQPCLADLLPILERRLTKANTFTQRDTIHGLVQRLRRIHVAAPGPFACRQGMPLTAMLSRSVHFPVFVQTEPAELLFLHFVYLLFSERRLQQARGGLSHLIVMDEGLNLWSEQQANIEEQPLLASLMAMMRESGTGLLATTVSTDLLHPIMKANAFLQVAMPLTNHVESTEIAQTFNLTSDEHRYFDTRTKVGECIVRLGEPPWRHAIFARFPDDRFNKTVTISEWEEAKRRTDVLAPLPVRPIEISESTAAAKEESDGQPTPSHDPATSSSPPRPLTAVVDKVTINEHAQQLLHDVAHHPLTLTTPAYDRCGLHWMQGDRAKQHLNQLGFISAHSVITGARRGKRGSALRVEPAGWTWLERTPPKGTRGGDSAQHEFTIRQLATLIPRASIEVTLGDKSVDLLIPYNTTTHAYLLTVLADLSERSLALKDGDLLAIEVEITDARRSAPRNASANRNAGINLTVIATMPRDVTAVRRLLGIDERCIVIDALQFVDKLGVKS